MDNIQAFKNLNHFKIRLNEIFKNKNLDKGKFCKIKYPVKKKKFDNFSKIG